ncbi:hypothetical protein AYL99_00736 [Fonsecaea erecta]|uniref:Uncharacterized protein n=1 Tax=Fonsecaea erecta TaxID=1367422 RepID=A0A178ZY57_9EURO|nr:hypothetical protein AYL99_00736 [Fonsecaea erecta]OAP64764.1 hypothetical protein AYL99_00736 [Fonsecaea erecta]
MAGRYIPPALRAKREQHVDKAGDPDHDHVPDSTPPTLRGGYGRPLTMTRLDALPDGDLCSTKEIERHFWPDREHETTGAKQTTLHDSAATPGVLSYVLLFKGANPRWQDDGIIFTKSSLQLLPSDLADKTEDKDAPEGTGPESVGASSTSHGGDGKENRLNEAVGPEPEEANRGSKIESATGTEARKRQGPIAVFSQVRRTQNDSSRTFKFAGYYRIVRLTFLQPHSADLVRMLEQKWSLKDPRTGHVRPRQRGASAWQESLNMEWAVVKFERDEAAMRSLGPLKVERLEDDEEKEGFEQGRDGGGGGRSRRISQYEKKKGLNELLRELRMGDEANKEKGDGAQEQKEKETFDNLAKEEQ